MKLDDLRLGDTVTLAGVIRTLDITDGDALLPAGEVLVTLHVKLDQPSPDVVLDATRDVVAQMTPAYAAWVTRNSPSVKRRLAEIVGAETADTLLAEFHIAKQDA